MEERLAWAGLARGSSKSIQVAAHNIFFPTRFFLLFWVIFLPFLSHSIPHFISCWTLAGIGRAEGEDLQEKSPESLLWGRPRVQPGLIRVAKFKFLTRGKSWVWFKILATECDWCYILSFAFYPAPQIKKSEKKPGSENIPTNNGNRPSNKAFPRLPPKTQPATPNRQCRNENIETSS